MDRLRPTLKLKHSKWYFFLHTIGDSALYELLILMSIGRMKRY